MLENSLEINTKPADWARIHENFVEPTSARRISLRIWSAKPMPINFAMNPDHKETFSYTIIIPVIFVLTIQWKIHCRYVCDKILIKNNKIMYTSPEYLITCCSNRNRQTVWRKINSEGGLRTRICDKAKRRRSRINSSN